MIQELIIRRIRKDVLWNTFKIGTGIIRKSFLNLTQIDTDLRETVFQFLFFFFLVADLTL